MFEDRQSEKFVGSVGAVFATEKNKRKNVYSNKKYLILQCLHT